MNKAPSFFLAGLISFSLLAGNGFADDEKVEAVPKAGKKPGEVVLFDGKALGKWKPLIFGGDGDVYVHDDKTLRLDQGRTADWNCVEGGGARQGEL